MQLILVLSEALYGPKVMPDMADPYLFFGLLIMKDATSGSWEAIRGHFLWWR